MKFNVTETIDAPAEHVWTYFTQFERFERIAAERGARMTRTGAAGGIGIGSGWRGEVEVRGRTRPFNVKLTDLARPQRIEVDGAIGGMEAEMFLNIEVMSPVQTRTTMTLDLKARTLAARLLLQSVKLARSRVMGRLQQGFARASDQIEASYRKG